MVVESRSGEMKAWPHGSNILSVCEEQYSGLSGRDGRSSCGLVPTDMDVTSPRNGKLGLLFQRRWPGETHLGNSCPFSSLPQKDEARHILQAQLFQPLRSAVTCI